MKGDTMQRAMAIRRTFFPPTIRFSAPSFKHFRNSELRSSGEPRFAAVSVTGSACALGCDHCRGKLLDSMKPATTPDALRRLVEGLVLRGCRGLLVSGGCDREGHVELEPFLPTLADLRQAHGLRVALHAGLADDRLAGALAAAGVDQVMIDLVGSQATARDVLHLDAPPERFEQALEALVSAGLAVTPHVVIGLHRGAIEGEREAIAMAARHPVAALVLVVVRPVPETPFAEVSPPAPDEIGALFAEARVALPRTPVHLGCARPLGREARAIEAQAVRAGLNGVAFPADGTVRLARQLGFVPEFEERCCSL